MHARYPFATDVSNDFPVPTQEQPPTSEASSVPRRTPDVPTADVPGVADSPGAIEYTSWTRLLRIGSA